MNDKKDFIDLREGAEKNEVIGNGPPPTGYAPEPIPIANKCKVSVPLIILMSLGAVVLIAIASTAAVGTTLFRNAADNVRVTTEVMTMEATRIDNFATQIETRANIWAGDLETSIMAWADDLEDNIMNWVDSFIFQDGMFFGNFQTMGQFYSVIDINLGTNNDLHILTHNDPHIMFDSGGRNVMMLSLSEQDAISVWDADQFGGGTLTVRIPNNWRGDINIISAGYIDISGDLPVGVVIND
ncbi:MAG: hypothetical protein FWE34_03425 [Defluviitaleaceae bacterium]|nr:hypothetical protein [Defluviitaleaceae bacterium]